MSIRQLKDAINIPTEQLDDWGTPKTIGEPRCHLNGIQLIENPDSSEGGIWECTPGKFVREIMQAELTTFLTGRAIWDNRKLQRRAPMSYAGDRKIIDADSHVIELDDFLANAATSDAAGLRRVARRLRLHRLRRG